MTKTQAKITNLVGAYQDIFYVEYEQFKRQMKAQRERNKDEFASTKGDNVIQRKLFEWPENLHTLFKARLEDEDWEYMDSKSGKKWFAKKFPQYTAFEKY